MAKRRNSIDHKPLSEQVYIMLLSEDVGLKREQIEKEYRFYPKRRWRFDFAIPDLKLGIIIRDEK